VRGLRTQRLVSVAFAALAVGFLVLSVLRI